MLAAVDGVPELLVTKAITARKIVSLMERIVAATFKQILRPFIFGILFADVLQPLDPHIGNLAPRPSVPLRHKHGRLQPPAMARIVVETCGWLRMVEAVNDILSNRNILDFRLASLCGAIWNCIAPHPSGLFDIEPVAGNAVGAVPLDKLLDSHRVITTN